MKGPAYEKVCCQGIADIGRRAQQTSCEIYAHFTTCKSDQTQLTNEEIISLDNDLPKNHDETLTGTTYWQTIDNINRRIHSLEMAEEKGK